MLIVPQFFRIPGMGCLCEIPIYICGHQAATFSLCIGDSLDFACRFAPSKSVRCLTYHLTLHTYHFSYLHLYEIYAIIFPSLYPEIFPLLLLKESFMAKTTETKDFVDHSIFYKFYALPLAIGYILWLAYIGYTDIYYGLMINHHVPVIDVGIQLAILWWLLDITLTKTTYRLEKDKLYMIKTGLWTKKELNLPYEDIFGVHHFKNQLMKPVTYRYTFHEYSKLDNRPIWSLLYDIGSDKKVGRVLMKASEEFWKEFEKRMPGQIRIPQEEVVMFTYKAMEKKLRDQGYFKDHPEMSFEEGIKQLRQKGTEMGGREDELTGADFHGEEVELENGTSKETLEAARRRKAIRDDETEEKPVEKEKPAAEEKPAEGEKKPEVREESKAEEKAEKK